MVLKVTRSENLNIYQGMHNVKMFEFKKDNNRAIGEKELSRVVNEMSRQFWNRQKNENFTIEMSVSMKAPSGWTYGEFFPVEKNLNFNPTEKHFNYETGEEIIEYEPPTKIIIYVVKTDMEGGCGKYNDCLFLCIRDFCNENDITIKKKYSSGRRLKNVLGLERKDKIHVNCIDDVEKFYQINIHICGDYHKQSKLRYRNTMKIQLKNGHFTRVLNKRDILNFSYDNEELKPLFFYEKNEKAYIYNPITKENKVEEMNDTIMKIKNKYICIRRDYDDDFNKICQKEYDDWKHLKEITNGEINVFKNLCSVSNTSLYLFSKFSDNKTEPEEMDEIEEYWIEKAISGPLMSSRGYNKLSHAVKYDINSDYGKTMSSSIIIPLQKPTYYTLDKLPEKGLKYGIYRCKITNNNNKDYDMLFRYNKNNYYTNKDITSAKFLGFDIELIKDETPNAMIYENRNTTGKNYFGNLINYLYDLKLKYGNENKEIKKILNRLWGSFLRKRNQYYKTDKLKTNDKIIAMRPSKGGKSDVKTQPKTKKFKYNKYARFAPFILSQSRQMKCMLLKDYIKDIYKIHTDGFICSGHIEKFDNMISEKLGMLKIEDEGACEVFNPIRHKFY